MKKTLLLLAILIGCDVQAKNYTDYEFVDYQKNIPMIDEFTRYEEATFHKYFYLQNDITYIDGKPEDPSPFDTCTLFEKKEYYSQQVNEEYDEVLNYVMRASTDFEVAKLTLGDLDKSKLDIKKMTLKMKDEIRDVDLSKVWNEEDNRIVIDIPNVALADFTVEIEYDAPNSAYITYTIENANSKAGKLMCLRSEFNRAKMKTLNPEDFQSFNESHGFSSSKFSMFYTHEEETYQCQKQTRVYTEVSEADIIDGQTFDPLEDETMYRVYKRQLLEEESSEESSTKGDDFEEKITDTPVSQAEPNTKETIKNVPLTNRTFTTPAKKVTTSEENGKIDEKTEEAEIETTTCREDYERLEKISNEQKELIRENEAKFKKITVLAISILIISILQLVYIFRVKRSK